MQYCIDSNFFIQGWTQYYSPEFCVGYWEAIATLGRNERLFMPREVYKEITDTNDELSEWMKDKEYMVRDTNTEVQKCLRKIYDANPAHLRLVDSTKGRSLADPWVIAHALAENATVVTKEAFEARPTKRPKIPNVCHNMGIGCINDFDFIRQTNISFSASILK